MANVVGDVVGEGTEGTHANPASTEGTEDTHATPASTEGTEGTCKYRGH